MWEGEHLALAASPILGVWPLALVGQVKTLGREGKA